MAKRKSLEKTRSDASTARSESRSVAKDRFVSEYFAALAEIPKQLSSLKEKLRPNQGVAMNSSPVIDHLLFRKLFAETFSDGYVDGVRVQGGSEFIVTVHGVRKRNTITGVEVTEECLESEFRHLLGPTDPQFIALIEDIRISRLEFPCSTDTALAWATRNRDTAEWGVGPNGVIYVSDWLIDALRQKDADGALYVLANAGQSIYVKLTTAQLAGDHEGQTSACGELENLRLTMEAFEKIKSLLPGEIGDPSSVSEWNDIKPSQRAQRIQLLVIAAVNGLKKHPADLEPFSVVEWLKGSMKHAEYLRFRGRDEYSKGAGWKPLSHAAVQDQLDNIASRMGPPPAR